MTQAYSNPARESDPHSLPDIEVFYAGKGELYFDPTDGSDQSEAGFYYWFCLPGCLPDSDPMGPFSTYDEALKAAQEDCE